MRSIYVFKFQFKSSQIRSIRYGRKQLRSTKIQNSSTILNKKVTNNIFLFIYIFFKIRERIFIVLRFGGCLKEKEKEKK